MKPKKPRTKKSASALDEKVVDEILMLQAKIRGIQERKGLPQLAQGLDSEVDAVVGQISNLLMQNIKKPSAQQAAKSLADHSFAGLATHLERATQELKAVHETCLT